MRHLIGAQKIIQAGNNNNKERPIFFPIHLHSIFDMVAVSRGLGKEQHGSHYTKLSYLYGYLNYVYFQLDV